MVCMIFICKSILCRQTSSSRPFSIIRLRNVSSRMNLSWTPWKNFFLHFFFNGLAEKYSLSPGFLPYRCPRGRPFLMTYSGIERRRKNVCPSSCRRNVLRAPHTRSLVQEPRRCCYNRCTERHIFLNAGAWLCRVLHVVDHLDA